MDDWRNDPEAIALEASQELAAARADTADRMKNQMSIADATMKALLLANGGAMIALFTFVGNLVAKSSSGKLPFDAKMLWIAFVCFVCGLVSALIVHALAFMSQDRFYNQAAEEAWRQQDSMLSKIRSSPGPMELKFYRTGMIFYGMAFIMALVSVAAFSCGCGFALSGVLV